jgi:hypothetical protein
VRYPRPTAEARAATAEMTDARASKMHSANAAAAEMSTAAKVAAPAEMGSPAEVAAATAAEVGAPAAAAAATTTSAPSRSRISCSSQNGRKKNNGESFYPGSFYSGHGTLERPPRASNERGSMA